MCVAGSSPTELARLQRPQSVSEAAGCSLVRTDPCGRMPCRMLARCEALTAHLGSGRRRRPAGAAWSRGTRWRAPAAQCPEPRPAPAHPAAAPAPAAARSHVALIAERSLQQPAFRPERRWCVQQRTHGPRPGRGASRRRGQPGGPAGQPAAARVAAGGPGPARAGRRAGSKPRGPARQHWQCGACAPLHSG
jgi:hypothetical protein